MLLWTNKRIPSYIFINIKLEQCQKAYQSLAKLLHIWIESYNDLTSENMNKQPKGFCYTMITDVTIYHARFS